MRLTREQIEGLRSLIKGATTNLWVATTVREEHHRNIDALCDMALAPQSETQPSNADITTLDDDQADNIGVDRLATAMKAKLQVKRAEGYYGWNNDCTMERLRSLFLDHISKGDILDVANFAMMIWNRENPRGK